MQNQSNLVVEEIRLQTQTGFGYNFDIPHNYVVYFEKEQNQELSLYIRQNYEDLKTRFAAIGLNFIYSPLLKKSVRDIEKVIAYYLPQLNYSQIPEKVSEKYKEQNIGKIFTNFLDDMNSISDKADFVPMHIKSEELLNLIAYEGKISSGLLFFNLYSGAIGVSDSFYSNLFSNYDLFFEEVLFYLKPEQEDFSLGDAMIANFLPALDLTENLDEDAKAVIKDIESRLAELKDSGQLLFVIPILKELLDKQTEKVDFKSISRIQIDKQNKILLPYFKKEVELSHLTKSVYFLFLKHPEGIPLKELGNYRKELLTIYTTVSNQLDHDKMSKSIDDVVNVETKAIYTHLSRIKSAFYKIMDATHAKHYVVSGNGEEKRKVLFNTNAIDWWVYDPIDDFEF
jgi:hypothetical protein